MQRNTALGFAVSGLALLGIVLRRPRLTLIFSGISAVFAGGSLLEYVMRADFRIDQLLGTAYVTTQTSQAGRVAPITAFCFLLLAAAFVLAQTNLINSRSSVLGITGFV